MPRADSLTPRQTAAAIAASLASIVVIVLGCRWLCDAASAGVFAVLALAIPYSLPVVSATLREAMDEAAPR
jgi:hypothetical protein